MRIHLLSPPSRRTGRALRPRHWPLFAVSTAAALREAGHDVELFDAHLFAPDPDATARRVLRGRPDHVVVFASDYNRQIPDDVVQVHLRSLAAYDSGRPLTLSGRLHHRRAQQLRELVPEAQAITVGEPESAVLAVVEGQDIGVLRTRGQPVIPAPLARLPQAPAWDLAPVNRYAFSPHQSGGDVVYPVLASRGCPFSCFYCEVRNQPRYAARPSASVVREIQVIRSRHGARSLFMADPMFGLNRRETLELLDALAPLGVRWSAMVRPDYLDQEVLARMARSGCWSLIVGVESTDPEVQRKSGKHLDIGSLAGAIDGAHREGIEVIASVMVGLPGDTPAGFRRTLNDIIELEPDFAQFFAVRLEPGLPFSHGRLIPRERASAYEFDGDQFVGDGFQGPEELEALCREAYARFYLRPRYVKQRANACRKRPRTELRRGAWGATIALSRIAGLR